MNIITIKETTYIPLDHTKIMEEKKNGKEAGLQSIDRKHVGWIQHFVRKIFNTLVDIHLHTRGTCECVIGAGVGLPVIA